MGNYVKQCRQARGMTLEELGERVGSSKAYMWQLENKDDPDPGVKLAVKIAKVLNFPVEEIFPGPPSSQRRYKTITA